MDRKTQNTLNWIELGNLWKQYIETVDLALIDYNKAPHPTYISTIYQNLLQRIFIGVRSGTVLLMHLNKSYFKFSIAIQLRAVILDSMIAVYLIDYTNNENEFKKQIGDLSHQTARNIKEDLEETFKNTSVSAEKRQEIFKTLSEIFPGNFNYKDKTKFNPDYEPISAFKMTNFYCANLKTDEKQQKWMKDCYDLYKHFSIYEHFNSLSKPLLDSDSAFDYDLNRFMYSTKFFFDASKVCLGGLKDDGRYIKKIDELLKKFNTLKPVNINNTLE